MPAQGREGPPSHEDPSSEGAGQLPDGWVSTTLRELARSRMGKTILKPDLTGAGLPVYSAGATTEPWGYIEECEVRYGI
jgi:hypothetical protein